jgi:hypothetical protein
VVPKEFQKNTYPEVFEKKKITDQHWSDPLPFLGFIREKIPVLYPYLYEIKIRIFPARLRELYVRKEIQGQLGFAVGVL